MRMMFEVSRTIRHASYWLIERYGDELDIVGVVERLKDGMNRVYSRSSTYVSRATHARMQESERRWLEMGVPGELANRVALLILTRPALDIVDIAAERRRDVIDSARLYARLNDSLRLFWLHNSAEDLKVQGRWQAMARSNLRDEIYGIRRDIGLRLLTRRSKRDPRQVVDQWLAKREHEVERYLHMIDEMKLRKVDFATLSVAAQELRDLLSS